MTRRRLSFGARRALVIGGALVVVLVGAGALLFVVRGSDDAPAPGAVVAGKVKGAVDGYIGQHGMAFGSSAAMTDVVAAAVPGAAVVDANTTPTAPKRTDAQVAVLVSGGPMFAFGVYDAQAEGGHGVCRYASTYGAGVGRWAYATGAPGVTCGRGPHGLTGLNSLVWSARVPAWAGTGPDTQSDRAARPSVHGERGPSALLRVVHRADDSRVSTRLKIASRGSCFDSDASRRGCPGV